MKRLLMFILLASLPAFNNCGNVPGSGSIVYGTEIGNPFSGPASQADSMQIVNALCQVLTNCDEGLSESTCQLGILGAPGVAAALGVPASTSASTLSGIQPDEQAGTVAANSTALHSCVAEISRLSCAEMAVSGAYAPLSATPFAEAYKMIPDDPVCSSVY